ncbi:lactate utilization protein [Halodesulfovibrio sp.]|jgi:L-lactate dehydrogenase complex protein LldG|uniref:LutC/YkgG family protein n=1 Tax=Halodesulfovibrio sp. TaxID=1912772 RepID=UPI0025F7836B|nr:lactate utilization protein [Halodesulfovibrio sp.]MCT4533903.1 lactate utilization protein [Halodesulfovibrio sp.]MCT4628135.1 lactate utilization protein [Halodesulfovibrio sp.]
MSNSAENRERILERLYNAQQYGRDAYIPQKKVWNIKNQPKEKNIEEFKERMSAVRTEVYRTKGAEWVEQLQTIVEERGQKTLLYAPTTPTGKALKANWKKDSSCKLVEWKNSIEDFKDELFACDGAVTGCLGGIAESAAVILWPTEEEPRLMSIVPPLHVVVVEADKIYTSFQEAIKKLKWNKEMPTNALLISGPSKTADIELILQFGVHGPTDLIVYITE